MTPAATREIAAFVKSVPLHSVLIDDGVNNGVELNGNSFDTQEAKADGSPQSIRSVLAVFDITEGALTAAATATLDLTLQDAADDGAGAPDAATWADVDVAAVLTPTELGADAIPTAGALVVTGTGGADSGQVAFGIMVERLRRHVRIQATVTLSNVADEVVLHGQLIAGGPHLADIVD